MDRSLLQTFYQQKKKGENGNYVNVFSSYIPGQEVYELGRCKYIITTRQYPQVESTPLSMVARGQYKALSCRLQTSNHPYSKIPRRTMTGRRCCLFGEHVLQWRKVNKEVLLPCH